MASRFEPIAEKFLDIILRGPSEYMCRCPFCDGKSSLQFNIDNGLWVCFRCDEKGNSKKLVRRMGGVYSDPAYNVEALQKILDHLKISNKKKEATQNVLPDSSLLRYQFDDPYWVDIRGYSNSAVKHWGLGYDPISDRHTIAYRNVDGELLGVIQRLKGDVFPRYIYPEGFDRKNSLFGSWSIEGTKAALVEGSTDVISLWESQVPALAQYGSSISLSQARLLHRLGIKELVLFYDYDEAGRKAEERSREILNGFVLRTVVWNTDRFCWHKKLCGCGEHTWRDIGKCQKKRLCDCGRKHGADPGSLKKKERKSMYVNAVLVGSKKKWPTRKFA